VVPMVYDHVWLTTKPIQLVTKIQSQAKQEF
jgi:hypothetical protein